MCNKSVLSALGLLALGAATSGATSATPAAQLIITAWYPLGVCKHSCYASAYRVCLQYCRMFKLNVRVRAELRK
jgi:hypothetical protein